MFRRVLLLCASVLFVSALAQAEITGAFTFPAGADGEIQYNNNGVFGGISRSSFTAQLTSTTLADLLDVNITGKASGDVLIYNGSLWVSSTIVQGTSISTSGAQASYVYTFNGSSAVWAAQGTSYAFSIASFANGLSATQEIGTGVWKASGTVSFTASYSNGPPTSSTVTFSGWATPLHLSSPFTSTTSVRNVNYPSVAGTVVFTLNGRKTTETDTETITHTFVNRRFYGVTTVTSGFTEANVEAATSELSNSKVKTFSTTAGSGEYLIWATPTRLGTVTFYIGGFEGGYTSPETVSLTNASGFTENYYVYRSVNPNLGTVNIVTE